MFKYNCEQVNEAVNAELQKILYQSRDSDCEDLVLDLEAFLLTYAIKMVLLSKSERGIDGVESHEYVGQDYIKSLIELWRLRETKLWS